MIVAHRLINIQSCDRTVVVEEGHIVEEGDHKRLLAKGGIYAGLYKSQENGERRRRSRGNGKKEKTKVDA